MYLIHIIVFVIDLDMMFICFLTKLLFIYNNIHSG